MQHNSYSKTKVKNIIKLHNQGFNPTEIAKKFDTYNTTIRRILLRNGCNLQNQSQAQVVVKTNPFVGESNYWLGFIAGDGNVYKNRIKVALSPKDEKWLKKYKNFIGYEVNILPEFNGEGHKSLSLAFKSKDIASWIKNEVNITANKSLELEVNPSFIDWDFMRGIMDADGWVCNKGTRITVEIATASEIFKDQITSFLSKEKIHHTINFRDESLFIIGIHTQSEVLKFWRKAYSNSTLNNCLERKAKKFLNGPIIQKWINDNIPNSRNSKLASSQQDNLELAEVLKCLGQV